MQKSTTSIQITPVGGFIQADQARVQKVISSGNVARWEGATSTQYFQIDWSSWPWGVRVSCNNTNANIILFDSPVGVNGNTPFNFNGNSSVAIYSPGYSHATLGYLQWGELATQYNQTANGTLGYWTIGSDGANANRRPTAYAPQPTFRIYGPGSANANQYIQFYNDGSTGVVTSASGSLKLEQNNDTYGTTRLWLQNRGGANGATLEQAGTVDLIDLVFKSVSTQATVRFEARSAQMFIGDGSEFQIGNADDPALVVSQNMHTMFRCYDTGTSAFEVYNADLGSTMMSADSSGNIWTSGQLEASYLYIDNSATILGDVQLGSSGTNTVSVVGRLVHRALTATTNAGTAREIAFFGNAPYYHNGTAWTAFGSGGSSSWVGTATTDLDMTTHNVNNVATLSMSGQVVMSANSAQIRSTDRTGGATFGKMSSDGSTILGAYFNIFGDQWSNTSQRGGAEFVFDSTNSGGGGFTVFEYNGGWTSWFKVNVGGLVSCNNGLSVTGSIAASGRLRTGTYTNASATGAISIDASVYQNVDITATGNVTLTFTNASNNDNVHIKFKQDATGGRTLAITGQNFGDLIPSLAVGTSGTYYIHGGANKKSHVGIRYDSGSSTWDVMSAHPNFA